MKIIIKKNAASLYASSANDHIYNSEWLSKLKAIEGKIIEVETKHLFKDQYNTVTIPGVSEQGMRIMDQSVEEVIGNVRIGKAKCRYCFNVIDSEETVCSSCGEEGFLEKF